jgi:hypothetical protein
MGIETGILLRFGASCAAHERSESGKNDVGTLQPWSDVRGGCGSMSSATHLGRSLPLQGLALEIGLVFPTQHAVCLVHVASSC